MVLTPRTRHLVAGCAAAALLAAPAATAPAAPVGKETTSYSTIGGDAQAPYSRLKLIPGYKRVVRDDLGAGPVARRSVRRRSLIYFAQLSDFQLADEESPARVEFVDLTANPPFTVFSAASARRRRSCRHGARGSIRQVNRFGTSPVAQAGNAPREARPVAAHRRLADSQQLNETGGWCGCSRAAP